MIVHPDFLDHWKTKKLIELTNNDPSAPLLMLRLWGYCQVQKQSEFDKTPNLSAICRSQLSTSRLLDMMLECHFVRTDGDRFIVHDWERCNRMLRSAWDNGKRGGHHKKREPTGSYSTDKIRKDKVGYRPVTGRMPSGREEQEKTNPEARQKFGQLLTQTAAKMRAGDQI